MQYQFEEPFIVDSSKITNTLGVHATPVEQALADTLAMLLPPRVGRGASSHRSVLRSPDSVEQFGVAWQSWLPRSGGATLVAVNERPSSSPLPLRWY